LAINTHEQRVTTTHIYDGSWANSDMPLFRRQAASSRGHKQDVKQFMEISYAQIRCSIADINC
jgi:hypothetical protein